MMLGSGSSVLAPGLALGRHWWWPPGPTCTCGALPRMQAVWPRARCSDLRPRACCLHAATRARQSCAHDAATTHARRRRVSKRRLTGVQSRTSQSYASRLLKNAFDQRVGCCVQEPSKPLKACSGGRGAATEQQHYRCKARHHAESGENEAAVHTRTHGERRIEGGERDRVPPGASTPAPGKGVEALALVLAVATGARPGVVRLLVRAGASARGARACGTRRSEGADSRTTGGGNRLECKHSRTNGSSRAAGAAAAGAATAKRAARCTLADAGAHAFSHAHRASCQSHGRLQ